MRTTIAIAGLAALASAGTTTVTATADKTITSCGPTVTNCPYAAETAWGEWSAASSSSTAKDPATTSAGWGEWSSASSSSSTTTTKKNAASSSDGWDNWSSASTTSAKTTSGTASKATTSASAYCPSYTATGPPEWFSYLPSAALSSLAAKWTGGPPADWCYYTYSTSGIVTSTSPVAPATTSGASWAAPTGASSSPVKPVGGSSGAATGTGAWGGSATTPVMPKWTGAANANAASLAIAGLAAAAAVVLA